MNRKTSTVYTPTQGGPATIVAVTTPPPSGTGAGFTTTTTMDVRWNVPVTISDPNGRITRAEYDAGGRLTKVWKNHRAATGTSGVTPDVEYAYVLRDNGPNYVSTKTLAHTGAQIESFAVLDGLLRPRRSETVAASGSGRMITDTRYDTVGSIDKKMAFFNTLAANPNLDSFTDADVPSLQRFLYDNQGQVLRDQLLAGSGTTMWETVYTYDGDKTTTMKPPAGGTATTTVNNARGHTIELRQHLGGTPAGAVDTTTKYTYDRLGQLKQVTDAANNTWTYTYDLLGSKVSTVDPDSGTSTSKFDNAGQLIETVDANNNKLVYKYDLLGRKTEVRETSLTGTLRASWSYDTAVFTGGVTPVKGQLASTSRFAAGNTYTSAVGKYDDAYRVIETTDTIPGFVAPSGTLTYTATNTYHSNGALNTRDVPIVGGLPQEKITYTYHSSTGLSNGVTSDVNGGSTYVASTSYFYDGQPDTVILGGTGKRINQTSTFDAATRRLTNTATATETTPVGTYSTKLSDTYTYDLAGNIKSIAGQTNGTADQEECFSYDHLRRLTEAWTQTSGACTAPQRTGADPYRRQWPTSGGYDKLGNRLEQIDKDTTDTTWNYTIGGIDSCGGASKPHAVTSITATGPKAGTPTRSFCYDQAGNTTKRTTDTGVVQNLTWDKEGHLASLADNGLTTSYLYDAAGRRLLASNSNKTTLYLPDGTELERSSTGTILGQRYYGPAVRDAAGLKWIISNHQESGTAQIDSLTLTVNRRRSMPFGEPRGTQPTWLGTKGFVGGTKDDTGLTHLGAREYDPTTGRFISVDPKIDPLVPQSLNAYLYANNSPATFSDPTGYDWWKAAIQGAVAAVVDATHGTANAIWDRYVGLARLPVEEARQTNAGEQSFWDGAYDIFREQVNPDGVEGIVEDYEERIGTVFAGEGDEAYYNATYVPISILGIPAGAKGFGGIGRRFCHSFDPATPVLMADGSAKPIEEVAVGDQVLATEPLTGETSAKPVTDLHLNQDWDLADVTVLNEQTNEVSIINTTWTHPFWNPAEQEWTDAAELEPGDRLRQPDGAEGLIVTDVAVRIGSARMRDLTIADVHTYYVIAGETPILVHNCGGKGWKVGDDYSAPTRSGAAPSWSTVRERFWKNEAAEPGAVDQYGAANVERMKRGYAPRRMRPNGQWESMELSHEPIPQRAGGTVVTPRWPEEHALLDPYRNLGDGYEGGI